MSKKQIFSDNQNIASDPTKNIWVQANAGTGKTTVLIQRLLRILFRNGIDKNRTKQSGILCLTYTNAAAGEMRNRILSQLTDWAMADDNKLSELLQDITINVEITPMDLSRARQIFFTYIDNPELLKIKTIHSFCEEILHRFPLEAGISPAWSLISGSAQTVLLQTAFEKMINKSFKDNTYTKRTVDAFYKIIDIKSEHFMADLQDLLIMHYKSFFQVDNPELYRQYFIDNIKQILKLNNNNLQESDIETIKNIIHHAKQIQKGSKKTAQYIQNIIDLSEQYIDNIINFDEYKNAYLTKENNIIKNVLKYDIFAQEAENVYNHQQYILNKSVFDNSLALFDLSMDFANTYKQIKQEQNLLDFEDLILYTQKLFSKPDVMGWVLSQLDISISHILVDEAQDTSPQQWNILRMLAGDFFTDGDTINNRSIFVVGDTKQSIYGFQNADPKAFALSRDAISEQIKQNYRTIQEISLDQSFRSVKPILDTVDFFFNNKDIVDTTGFHNNNHKCFRTNDTGFVELHDVFKTEETGTKKTKQYTQIIANKIKSMIQDDQCSPNDIMVLLQKRNPFAIPLSTALKKQGIDVAGSDRVNLPSFPAIKDFLHLIRLCINTNNDYSLCCVLKSPLYSLKERDIFDLCKIKNSTKAINILSVLQSVHPDIYDDLLNTIEQSKKMPPYSFFTYILNKNNNRRKFITAMGKQIIDPLEEFLTMCLAYERTQSGTLYHFLKWFVTGDSEIKRDMDASNGVRIMTVHGSKGLASPIVFLIDTLTVPKNDTMLNINHLHNNSQYDLWLWKTNTSEIIQSICDKIRQDDIAEYYRLLYVAMTRTRDKLYIYGCDSSQKQAICWHSKLWEVLSQIKDAHMDENTIRITNDTKFE